MMSLKVRPAPIIGEGPVDPESFEHVEAPTESQADAERTTIQAGNSRFLQVSGKKSPTASIGAAASMISVSSRTMRALDAIEVRS
jgi:hypothetical protein